MALYYRTLGLAGDTLIVVHGGPFVDHGYLAPDLEPLAETHVPIFYAQRGTGRSTLVPDAAPLHIGAHIADLEAVRRHVELSRMTLLGHSWGALLAAGYAREHSDQVSALIALSPAPLRCEPYWQELLPRVTASLGDFDWRQHFRGSRFPVLVIAGAKDADLAEAYQEWQAAFADARTVLLADPGHFSFVEQPEQVVGVAIEFLRSHSRGCVEEVTG